MTISRLAIACALAGSALLGCARYEPPRPPSLPAVAVYAGGVDGGDWVACEGEPDGALHCRIFDPENGELRRASWFRYCPQSGSEHAGAPGMLDARGLHLSRAILMRDRRDVFHPPAGAAVEQIQAERQLIEESYHENGVDRGCLPMSAPKHRLP